jgi:hypothetical protein
MDSSGFLVENYFRKDLKLKPIQLQKKIKKLTFVTELLLFATKLWAKEYY